MGQALFYTDPIKGSGGFQYAWCDCFRHSLSAPWCYVRSHQEVSLNLTKGGIYPSRILADKIYRNRENLSYCKAHGIRLSGPALGRPKKGETRDKAQDYRDDCERVEVERRFSLAKRKCGMGLVTAKLRETAAHVIAMSVLVLNLRKIQCAILRLLTYLLAISCPWKNGLLFSRH